MRILMSLFIILSLPYFVRETDEGPKEERATSHYCNTVFNYCLEFPSHMAPLLEYNTINHGIAFHSPADGVIIAISGNEELTNMNLEQLYDHYIKKSSKQRDSKELIYKIINENYCEASYNTESHQYYQKLLQIGNKTLMLEIAAPLNKSHRVRQLKEEIKLDTGLLLAKK